MHSKAEYRLAIKERLRRLSAKERERESRTVVKGLRKLLGNEATTVAAYVPMADEPNILPLLKELLEKGWQLALPRISRADELKFHLIRSLADVESNAQTRLSEPVASCPELKAIQLQIAIVPGRAYTAVCDRLGRGNGGYDRWIRKQRMANAATRFIGVCFECQILPAIVTEEHDEKVDAVVTARGIHRIGDR